MEIKRKRGFRKFLRRCKVCNKYFKSYKRSIKCLYCVTGSNAIKKYLKDYPLDIDLDPYIIEFLSINKKFIQFLPEEIQREV